jgi:hypothetical protein
MNLAERSSSSAPARSWLLISACSLVLMGCGGSVYSFGNAPGDAGAANDGPEAQKGAGRNGPTTDSGLNGASNCTAKVMPFACTGDAKGYACSASGNPQNDSLVAVSCTSGTINGYEIDYCCFPWLGTGGPCEPYPGFPCSNNSYAYQCKPGTLPSSVDARLSCGTNFPDSNGKNDFCCTYQ